jgi:glutaredoxin
VQKTPARRRRYDTSHDKQIAMRSCQILHPWLNASDVVRNALQIVLLMNSLEQKILAAFDGSGEHTRSLADLGDPASVREIVSQLVGRGWLRATGVPDTYARTEDGRLQLAAPRDVTIYSRPGCTLCEEAKMEIAPLLKEFGARLTEINIDEDPHLHARFDYDVPVIFLGARKAAKHRVDLAQFRRQLRDAAPEL